MRIYVASDNVYIIRDVFDHKGNLVTCQYATADFDADVVRWTDCREGVLFDEIAPVT